MSQEALSQAGPKRAGLMKTIRREFKHPITKWAYVFMLPGVVWLFLLHFYPIFRSIYYSLHQWSGHVTEIPKFIGVANYVNILQNQTFWTAVLNTFYYVVLTVPVNTVFSMIIAVLITNVVKGQSFYKILYFVPSVVGLVVASVVWRWCYEPMFGIFNYILQGFGIPGLAWLKDPSTAMLSIAIMTIWQNMGYYVVIFLAGLTAIPQELYEVSKIDGASRLRQFLSITIPLLAPITMFVMMFSTIKNIKIFGEIFVMTGGGPGTSTVTMGFKIYEEAFRHYNYGTGNTMAIVMFLIILLISIIQFKVLETRTRVEY
jgi:ABC-type sugar transport system permease subunit